MGVFGKTAKSYVYCTAATAQSDIMWMYFYLLAPKCIDSWILEFVFANITCHNQWEDCISLNFNLRDLSEPQNQWKLEPHD